ncbi:MAG: hypothetical protein M1120_03635, partial [Patescibacteria group bacterium]|nr:hypothetical protein [Patescibacteria group bacterium]
LVVNLLLLSVSRVAAVYDPTSVPNNKFGIHILFPSELDQAARLINSSGGEWGYVTIPIRSDDRNLEKWQAFMDEAKRLKIIPILRLSTYPSYGDTGVWSKPTMYDPLDWANFLDSLNWPTKNRYVIVYNEPNRANEWGGSVSPFEYAKQLFWTIDDLKKLSDKFFVLPAGLDASAPDSKTSMSEFEFIDGMYNSYPDIFDKIDGWTSHSYPNPDFISLPSYKGYNGILSYQYELNYLQNNFGVYGKKVFITETGWDIDKLGETKVSQYFLQAFNNVWNNSYLVAVTPFLLSAQQGDFKRFSFLNSFNDSSLVYQTYRSLNKISGRPELEPPTAENLALVAKDDNSNWSAQKTNFWHKTTKEWVKIIVSWFLK